MRNIFLGILLVLAACRSLPQETYDDILTANAEASAAINVWSAEIQTQAGKGDASIGDPDALYVKWADHFHKLVVARDAVQSYLDSNKGDPDVSMGYNVASRLLLDLDTNIQLVLNNWPLWIDPTSNTSKFIADVNGIIADYAKLNKRFNDWVKQFKVK